MTQIRFLACLISGLMLLAACNKDKSQAPATTAESNPVSTAPASTPPVAETPAPPPPLQPPTPPKPVVIPVGTVLTVHLRDAVGSKTSNAGDRFNASLAKSVRLDEKIVIPEGSRISGRVTEAHAAGRFKGGATLDLAVDTASIQGTTYHIRATPVTEETKGKGKRTAGMVGGGTGGGALIGGIAGGGKGAAIGALVGGGAGTVGAAFTGNRDITLPAEMTLSFKMTAPLTLNTDKLQAAAAAPPLSQ